MNKIKNIIFPLIASCVFVAAVSAKTEDTKSGDTRLSNVGIHSCCAAGERESPKDSCACDEIRFLRELYEKHVFGGCGLEGLEDHFADSVLTRLKKGYDMDGEGYALWLLRTGFQDGPEDESSVLSIYPCNGGFKVAYSDMGHRGSTTFKLRNDNGKVIVEDFESETVKK